LALQLAPNMRLHTYCAVLYRRLIEMLLILSFKEVGGTDQIKDSNGNYMHLSQIVKKATSSRDLDLTRNTKQWLPILCLQGHLSAHNPFYIATEADFDADTRLKLRVVISELLQKSKIRS